MATISIRKPIQNESESAFAKHLSTPFLKKTIPNTSHEKWKKIHPEVFWKKLDAGIALGNHFSHWNLQNPSPDAVWKSWLEWENEDKTFADKILKSQESLHYQFGANERENDFLGDYAASRTEKEHIFVLRIPANVKITEPLILESFSEDAPAGLHFFRTILFLEEGSQADIVMGKQSLPLEMGFRQIYLEDNTSLHLYSWINNIVTNNPGGDSTVLLSDKIYVGNNSRMTILQMNNKNKLASHFSDIWLEKRATLDYFSANYTSEGLQNTEINVFHHQSYSESSIVQNSIAADNGHSVFRGNIIIPSGTIKCTGEQQNKNLIIGKNALAEAIPQLEISTDDVEANHGSATGELDEEQLFYLLSRGIPEEDARALLTVSFLESVLERSVATLSSPRNKESIYQRIWEAVSDSLHITREVLDEE